MRGVRLQELDKFRRSLVTTKLLQYCTTANGATSSFLMGPVGVSISNGATLYAETTSWFLRRGFCRYAVTEVVSAKISSPSTFQFCNLLQAFLVAPTLPFTCS